MESNTYTGVEFFAEFNNGHKKTLAGTVIMVIVPRKGHPQDVNGTCRAAIGVAKGDAKGLPVRTWASARYLKAQCERITEAQAREIQPALFTALAKFERAAEYRLGHAIESHKAAQPLQLADDVGAGVNHFERLYGG
jgi:hypothetical protein